MLSPYPLPNHDPETWAAVSQILSLAAANLPGDAASLEALVASCAAAAGNQPPPLPFAPLRAALAHGVLRAQLAAHGSGRSPALLGSLLLNTF
jgi:hypothetical protein